MQIRTGLNFKCEGSRRSGGFCVCGGREFGKPNYINQVAAFNVCEYLICSWNDLFLRIT